jgi:hypothetical protein
MAALTAAVLGTIMVVRSGGSGHPTWERWPTRAGGRHV